MQTNFYQSIKCNHVCSNLNNLKEDGGSVPKWLSEYLQQDALVVLVDEDAHLLAQQVLLLRDAVACFLASSLVVVATLSWHEFEPSPVTSLPHQLHRVENIICEERQVLHTSILKKKRDRNTNKNKYKNKPYCE